MKRLHPFWLGLIGAMAFCADGGLIPAQEKAPASSATPATTDAWHDRNNPIVKLFGGERLDLWSLQPVRGVTPPRVRRTAWVRNPIDQFIAAGHDAAGVVPTIEADRRTLARRAAFDLTGLPPTPEQVAQFMADKRPDAYERYVDALLASPRYGEHLARMWLDVVRYSDSNGFDWDEFRPQAWRYRDYVIRSFNADKPFPQFVTEQLAGDELRDGPPTTPAEQDALIATGFLRLGPYDNAAPLFNEQDRARTEFLADVVETTGSAFLGLTMSCCRCHDHKYDPLSQADFYRLRAFFEPVSFADDLPLDLAAEQQAIQTANAQLDQQQKSLEDQRTDLLAPVKQRLQAERRDKLSTEERAVLDLPEEKQSEDEKAQAAALRTQIEPNDQDVRAALDDAEQKQLQDIESALEKLAPQRRSFTTGLCVTNSADEVPATHVLYQGDHRAPRDAVVPGFLSVLDPQPAELGAPGSPPESPPGRGRRRTLARWITAPQNPFTARVFVNRIWQTHFGRGLVATPNDFGLSGARPSHPELLDWLAHEFARQNGSVKKLQRLIVTSATYRQSSQPRETSGVRIRPNAEGPLYQAQSPRRLTAEQLRDALLAVSGLLTDKTSGPPVWPDLPEDILKANPAFLDDNALKVKGWYPSAAEEQPARSIFLVQKRAVRVPFLETFDLPENMVSCARRPVSTVAPQALTLLNSPLAAQVSNAFAARLEKEVGRSPHAQVERAFQLALQRAPGPEEFQACRQFLETRTLAELCRVVLNLNEFLYAE
ncbi:MAG: DUF1553 domain-containing protein [Planctomycetes bacterium]|nr:DUF1553 domain-containing protein [Planctomycetota bacterium]